MAAVPDALVRLHRVRKPTDSERLDLLEEPLYFIVFALSRGAAVDRVVWHWANSDFI